MNAPFPIRQECPPGACECERERLLNDPQSDLRVLRLTKEEEKRLLARLESLTTLADVRKMQGKLFELLGITLRIEAGVGEVRTVRGLVIELESQPGLCRKTRQTVPAALRRCFEAHPDIVYTLLDEGGLFER